MWAILVTLPTETANKKELLKKFGIMCPYDNCVKYCYKKEAMEEHIHEMHHDDPKRPIPLHKCTHCNKAYEIEIPKRYAQSTRLSIVSIELYAQAVCNVEFAYFQGCFDQYAV